jgi:serine/threonine protein kinase
MLNLEVVRKVADGSAVEAFLARSGERQVLVQVSRPELSDDPELYGRFLDQSRAAERQRPHPALLTVRVSHCSSDGRFVLLSEPLSGRTAADHLRTSGPLQVGEAARWALRLCDALEWLHAGGLVHGHLSPGNVYLEGEPSRPDVKLLDTGLLLFRAERSLKPASGLVLVPPEYLSPERVEGRRGDAVSDVYGLGVLLFELVTGRPPFRGRDADETRALHLRAAMPPLPARAAEWDGVLRRCLARDPVDRFRSMAEVRAAVRELEASARHGRTPVLLAALAPEQTADVSLGGLSVEVAPPAAAARPLAPGDALGSYLLDAPLGEGGMGAVFLATHRALGRRVAIKVLRPELEGDPAQVARFVLEAQAVNRVRHPHIVEVHDLVQEPPELGGHTYFVMELLEGESLKALGKARPFELRRAVRLVRQAAEALAAAHAVGVVHRDVKPENLVVVKDAAGAEVVKVLDFGVARVRSTSSDELRTTRVGQVVGTPLWMAPEQIVGRDVDARADVYGLMTVLYVLLVRRFPSDGASASDVVLQRIEREALPVGAHAFLGEPIPSALQRLIAEGLARDVARRPSTMAEVAQRLSAIEDALAALPVSAPPSPARAWGKWIAAGVALAAVLASAWLLNA